MQIILKGGKTLKTIKIVLLIIYTFIILFFIAGCSQEKYSLNDKVKSEIEYLSTKFINILNRLNNITFENYQVTTVKAELSEELAKNEKTSESPPETGSSVNADVSSSSGNYSNQIIASQMSPNTILNPVTSNIDWAGIKNDIENVYYSWNTILLDMYQLNANKDDILGFSSSLNTATSYIENQDKSNSILAMANLYGYLPKFAEEVLEDKAYNSVYKTKSFILNAYSLIEIDDWQMVKEEIDKANDAFKSVTTNVEFVSKNSYRVNKTYVLLNEIKNSLNTSDKSIFYIQYRNLMEEICEL